MASSSTSRLPDATLPPLGAVPLARVRAAVVEVAPRILWGALSIGLFAGLWEACWALGWSDPKLLPPPHVFIGNIVDQAKFFNTVNRWQIGVGGSGPSPPMAVFYTVLSSTWRVLTGLVIAFTLAISTGVTIRYFRLFEKLTLPTITLLAPVSPIAWLPVAIFLFGIGNGPAIFMVVVALFFHMVLAHHHTDRQCEPQLHQRRAHDGSEQAADLFPGRAAGDPAGVVHSAAAQSVRRVDGGIDCRGNRRGLRAGSGDHAGA
jgi:ABC-type nitrate/sulfonate/bicarbonate transport system permease component